MTLIRATLCALCLCTGAVRAQRLDSTEQQSVVASYEYNQFNQASRSHWHQGTIEYKRRAEAVTLIGRLNYARRFNSQGWQGELEAYPEFSRKVYGYIGAGFSGNQPAFPKWRSGASLFWNLRGGWELEGGARYLRFSNNLWMATVGVGKYVGNWFIVGRSFLSLNDPQGTSQSVSLTARYYLPSGTDYVWIQAASGISPDETQAAQLLVPSVQRHSVAGGIRTAIARKHLLLASAALARNEYRKGNFGSQLTVSAGYGIRF